jgi:hypothetical protein
LPSALFTEISFRERKETILLPAVEAYSLSSPEMYHFLSKGNLMLFPGGKQEILVGYWKRTVSLQIA